MDPFTTAIGVLAIVEAGIDLVNKIRANAATGNQELTEEQRKELDDRINKLKERKHWIPTSS